MLNTNPVGGRMKAIAASNAARSFWIPEQTRAGRTVAGLKLTIKKNYP